MVKEPPVTFSSSLERWLIIWVRLRPAATMNMDTMVTTVELPNAPSAVLASTQPVSTRATSTAMEVKDMGSCLMKNPITIKAKMIRQIVMVDT